MDPATMAALADLGGGIASGLGSAMAKPQQTIITQTQNVSQSQALSFLPSIGINIGGTTESAYSPTADISPSSSASTSTSANQAVGPEDTAALPFLPSSGSPGSTPGYVSGLPSATVGESVSSGLSIGGNVVTYAAIGIAIIVLIAIIKKRKRK